jgi:DeoR/GlpR family transcriptional regulator of sugar metabolism
MAARALPLGTAAPRAGRSHRRKAARERRGRILELLDEQRSVRVSSLSRALGVSQMTIRRDLELLDAEGLATRAFGGALRRL